MDNADRDGILEIGRDSVTLLEKLGRRMPSGPRIPIGSILKFAGFTGGELVRTFGGSRCLTIATPATAEKMIKQLELADLATKIMRGDKGLVGRFVYANYGRKGWAIIREKIIGVYGAEDERPGLQTELCGIRVHWLFDPKTTIFIADSDEEITKRLEAIHPVKTD